MPLRNEVEVPNLKQFVGQPDLVSIYREEITASKARGTALPNAIFFGPGGLGKTLLVRVISAEREVAIHKLFGSQLTEENITEAIGNCCDAGHNDKGFVVNREEVAPSILYINEAHNAQPAVLEILHDVCEPQPDGRRIFRAKERGSSERKAAWCPEVTVVFDTNFIGKLKKRNAALLNRCPIKWRFDPYSTNEIITILQREATFRREYTLSDEAAKVIAERCLGIPRTAKAFLDRAASKMFASIPQHGRKVITGTIATQALDMLGVDAIGLETAAREYLKVLAANKTAKMSLHSIASSIGSDQETVTVDIEPFLLRAGLVITTAGGRQITEKGLQHIGVGSANPIRKRFLSNVEI
jgi:Holliday junction DNA helicase RuvB